MANTALHRDKLVQAAVKLFREQGYAGTGLNEILQLSGAPKGSLYHYFPGGKEELAAAAVKLAGAVVTRTLRELTEQWPHPRDMIQRYCELLAMWMEQSGFKSGCPITTTVLEMVPKSALITAVSREVFSDWVAVIADAIKHQGLTTAKAKQQAEFVISAIEGALIQTRVQQSTLPIRRVVAHMVFLE